MMRVGFMRLQHCFPVAKRTLASTTGSFWCFASRSFQYRNSANSATNAPQNTQQRGSESKDDQSRSSKIKAVLGLGAVVVGVAVYTATKHGEAGFEVVSSVSQFLDCVGLPDRLLGTAITQALNMGKRFLTVQKDEESMIPNVDTEKFEPTELPKEVPYLIVGAGTAAFAAYRAIRAADSTAKVLLVTDDNQLPYMRPPLSKELWYSDDLELLKQLKFKQWNGKERSLFYEKDGFYCQPIELVEKEFGGVAVALRQKVVRLDVKERRAYFADGNSIAYEKCLIATGGRPRNVSVIEEAGPLVLARCTLFRNVDDFWKLQQVTRKTKSLAVVGGGFLGSELACCLGKKGQETGMKVIQIFPERGNMGQVLPEYLTKWTTEKVRKEGVEVLPETFVTSCSYNKSSQQVILKLNNGNQLSVDHVVIAVGLEPNTDIAAASGLETDPQRGGFLVNAELEARSNVWVAGDAACFFDTQLGRRRVEHHDHAVVSGRLAGENMVGAGQPYWHQSMFWSDLGPDVGYEAIGLVDSSLPTVGIFAAASDMDSPRAIVEATGEGLRSETEKKVDISVADGINQQQQTQNDSPKDFGKGIIFYLRDKVIVGVVMWNVFNKMAIARQIIKDAKTYEDLSEVAKLFNLYGEPVNENVTATERKTEEINEKKESSS